ncbi:BEAN1 isoform 7 [Pongo abelii]|uniref:BEAN1 isoform 7 n=1 Tax=Pongo abelii TaxID=9601 RepID=A0A2J8VU92_PONAB|nr:BEAN1 isoform 7 [Pongo abelii]
MSFKRPCPCKFPPRILPPLGARQGQSLESSCRERLEVFGQRTAGVQPEANVACWVGRGQHGRPLTSARCSLRTEKSHFGPFFCISPSQSVDRSSSEGC